MTEAQERAAMESEVSMVLEQVKLSDPWKKMELMEDLSRDRQALGLLTEPELRRWARRSIVRRLSGDASMEKTCLSWAPTLSDRTGKTLSGDSRETREQRAVVIWLPPPESGRGWFPGLWSMWMDVGDRDVPFPAVVGRICGAPDVADEWIYDSLEEDLDELQSAWTAHGRTEPISLHENYDTVVGWIVDTRVLGEEPAVVVSKKGMADAKNRVGTNRNRARGLLCDEVVARVTEDVAFWIGRNV